MIGERLGKWVIYKELGRGGMGRVYLAQEEIGGRQAALKVLAPELAQDAGFLHRFQREIETLQKLDHPHIVKFYESGYENGVYFYAMLTGRPPFEGNSYLDLLHKHRYAQFDRPQRLVPEIPYELDEVVCQLLEKDPAARPADCLVLSRQLQAIRRKLERKGHKTEA